MTHETAALPIRSDQGEHVAGVAVGPPRHQTIAHREGRKAAAFPAAGTEAGPLDRLSPARGVDGRTESGQRPEIQQHQKRRERDEHRLGHQAERKQRRHEQIAPERPAVTYVAEIGAEREHEKQSAQHVAPLGDPGHLLDVLRMDGKDRGHEGAGPKLVGHAPQNEKQRDRRSGVEQHIGEMMSPGIQSKELAIEHVRQRGQRIPLAELVPR